MVSGDRKLSVFGWHLHRNKDVRYTSVVGKFVEVLGYAIHKLVSFMNFAYGNQLAHFFNTDICHTSVHVGFVVI